MDGKPAFVIHKEVRALGFSISGNSAIVRVLGNCVYAGLIRVPAYQNSPERYIKGIHRGIISEEDFWLAQEMLGNKRPSKTQANSEVPLRGVLKCPCGLSMTSGWSKGKKKYYLYYRCTKHHGINIPAIKLHEEWNEILRLLSFSPEQVNRVIGNSKANLQATLKGIVEKVGDRQKELTDIETKIERLEEKMMNDEIEPSTYKKWFNRYAGEKAFIVSEIKKLKEDNKDKWQKMMDLLPTLLDIPGIFEKADINDQHSLIREVFKHPLMYKDGMCRTPTI
ncbi:recombinase family protein [Mucilaginibacter gossypii]|uniref:recombinase family protein n=1 Tax=Mucilaginibacter gossypii TaxID=551996 RepID=UPI001FB6654F|nr:recombinase family protein [Mucilaginibacter gossypii]QTE40438.2 recombinase family protein [Mucilaginibacter gossypii]